MRSPPGSIPLRVVDFFCGAGGFSEGFRQQGFQVLKGYDNWRPAVATHNLNHGLDDGVEDILAFEEMDPKLLAADDLSIVPDAEVIVGSPPCVSFSMSNKAGKADKSLGIRLIEAYLRVVAVKKHKRGSTLKAWFLENVPNSRNFVEPEYTFAALGLAGWAKSIGKKASAVALKVRDNGDILCAADYGSPQTRERFVCGEWVSTGEFPAPRKTHDGRHVTLGQILEGMPNPSASRRSSRMIQDPNYPILKMPAHDLSDHFYDTGVYQVEWRSALYAKRNHPFMGRMAFPEGRNRPSRTVMATRSASTREALLYASEYGREGDGQYRLPTIREAATLMGFPSVYQFSGSEGTKWKQIGNAICPHLSFALAISVRRRMGLGAKPGPKPFKQLRSAKLEVNLNTWRPKLFDNPPRRKHGAKFRRHPFKIGNLTIALTNYLPGSAEHPDGVPGKAWHAVAFLGSGKTYRVQILGESNLQAAREILEKSLPRKTVRMFIRGLQKSFLDRTADGETLNQFLREPERVNGLLHPVDLIDDLSIFLEGFGVEDEIVSAHGGAVVDKVSIHLKQVLAVAAIGEVAKKASPKSWADSSQSASGRVQEHLFEAKD